MMNGVPVKARALINKKHFTFPLAPNRRAAMSAVSADRTNGGPVPTLA
jgi:hypothetical protein